MLLSLDSSAVTASVALTDGEKIINNEFINSGLTHSETLMPMVKRVMSGYDYSLLDAVAVNAGPGSFTGIRIGVAAAKGIAFVNNTPCIAVSTLESIAYNFINTDCIVCAVMDARRMQFYNAIFRVSGKKIERICDDRAISIENLNRDIAKYDKVIVAGDGAKLCCENLNTDNFVIADDNLVYQNALGVARAAEKKETVSHTELVPVYLRPSQAERELKLKRGVLR